MNVRKMNTLFLLLQCLILATGCNSAHIRDDFAPYYRSFLREAAKRGVGAAKKVSIEFSDDLDEAGVCEESPVGTAMIKINRRIWDRQPFSKKEALVFHELGHCVLGRDHRDSETIVFWNIKIPSSIMASDDWFPYYGAFREYYLDELFLYRD
jgi:hypothetical protein